MSDLYKQIDNAEKFNGQPADITQRDHGGQVSFGLDMARRLAERPQEQPQVKQMAPIVPVAS